jgi:heme exporter protein A
MAKFSGDGLVCVRGERAVFADLSFDMSDGDALVLIGPNGSGKSSLLRMMTGLLPPFSGVLRWGDTGIGADPEAHRRRVRYVGHPDAVKPAFTVFENLHIWAQLWRGSETADERTEDALDRLGILRLADVPARFLSAGQRRRLGLARLLVAPAALWLLDEPGTALDTDATLRLDGIISSHRAAGGMVVMALHGGARPEGARILDLATAELSAETAVGC